MIHVLQEEEEEEEEDGRAQRLLELKLTLE